jgi:hypothetical protein
VRQTNTNFVAPVKGNCFVSAIGGAAATVLFCVSDRWRCSNCALLCQRSVALQQLCCFVSAIGGAAATVLFAPACNSVAMFLQ